MVRGEQGVAKSTFHRLIKKLVDPGIPSLLTFPRYKDELTTEIVPQLRRVF